MTTTIRRTLLYVVIVASTGIVLCIVCGALTASIARAEDCAGPECCACEPAGAAEPDPLPHLYLPSVQRSMPPMAAEYTPVQPAPTVTPDPAVTGDVQ